MARRTGRKAKPAPVTLPGAMGRQVEIVDVQDPYEGGAKTTKAMRAVNHSPLDHMLARKRLQGPGEVEEDGLARHRAGTRLQAIVERAGARGAGAIDYSRVKVDVFMHYEGTPEGQAAALKQLRDIGLYLGERHYLMLRAVCGDGRSFYDVVAQFYPHTGWSCRMDCYQEFRDALDSLISYFGIAVGPGRRFHVKRS